MDSAKAKDFDVLSDPDSQKAWRALDDTLCLPHYAMLEHVIVRLFEWDSDKNTYYPIQADVIKAALPKLSTRQNADFTPSPFPM